MPVITCKCGVKVNVGEHLLGKQIACPACGKRYQLRPSAAQVQPASPNWDLPVPPAASSQPLPVPPVQHTFNPAPYATPRPSRPRSKKPLLIAAGLVGGIVCLAGLMTVIYYAVNQLGGLDGLASNDVAHESSAVIASGESPRIPLAALRVPDECLSNTPFELNDLFEAPADDLNAAPLYLTAFAEFSDHVALCFPPADQAAIVSVGSARRSQIESMHKRNLARMGSVADKVAPLVSQCEVGFRKLQAAQERPHCMFQFGTGISSLLPHTQAATTVVQYLSLKTQQDLRENDLDAAIGNARMAFRLARDLRPGGGFITQVAADAMLTWTQESIMFPVLRHPQLTSAHCEQLADMIQDYQQQAIDGAEVGLRREYIVIRTTIRNIQTRSNEFDPAQIPKYWGNELGDQLSTPGKILAMIAPGTNSDVIDAKLRRLGESDFDHEIELLNQYNTTVYASTDQSFKSQRQAIARATTELVTAQSFLTAFILPAVESAFVANLTAESSLNATKCFVAVAKYRIETGQQPTDLLDALKHSGMTAIPEDPFSQRPLKYRFNDGKLLVYSIGSDLIDDGGDKPIASDRTKSGLVGDYSYRL